MSGTVRTQAQMLAEVAGGFSTINAIVEQDIVATMFSLARNVLTPNAQTASYTFTIADISQFVLMNVTTTANNLTIPPNASVALPVGQFLYFAQIGTGVTTLLSGAAVTFLPASPQVMRQRGSSGWAYQYAANTWLVAGDFL